MSCLGSKTCLGLDSSDFLRTWNGKAWGPASAGMPAGVAIASYDNLSCISATYCVALGTDSTATPTSAIPVLVAATWNGKAWSARKLPSPAKTVSAYDTGLSCVSARFCVAVGHDQPPYSYDGSGIGFADVWNGTKWAVDATAGTVGMSTPGQPAGDLNAVSCQSSGSCLAVGDTYYVGSTYEIQDPTYRPVVLLWNGKGWTKVTPPVPAGGRGYLQDVSCWSVKHCVVAGGYHPPHLGVTSTAFADFWNGTKWTATKLPSAGLSPQVNGVSCFSVSRCLAVGATTVNDGEAGRAIADTWNGKSWKAVPVATPKGGTGSTGGFANGYYLYSLACATPAECVTIGVVGPLERSWKYFAEAYNGTRLSNIAEP
jgi:hypothetical protein